MWFAPGKNCHRSVLSGPLFAARFALSVAACCAKVFVKCWETNRKLSKNPQRRQGHSCLWILKVRIYHCIFHLDTKACDTTVESSINGHCWLIFVSAYAGSRRKSGSSHPALSCLLSSRLPLCTILKWDQVCETRRAVNCKWVNQVKSGLMKSPSGSWGRPELWEHMTIAMDIHGLWLWPCFAQVENSRLRKILNLRLKPDVLRRCILC